MGDDVLTFSDSVSALFSVSLDLVSFPICDQIDFDLQYHAAREKIRFGCSGCAEWRFWGSLKSNC